MLSGKLDKCTVTIQPGNLCVRVPTVKSTGQSTRAAADFQNFELLLFTQVKQCLILFCKHIMKP